MKYLSLFSGIEAATVAWHPLGWECVAVAEIEPFPAAVLAHHYPAVPNLGDVTTITSDDIAALGKIDLVVFGSPCQDLSVAGKRLGFDGERSGLFTAATRIVRWARERCGCRFALWENVPGAFSSNQGRDFAVVVEQMAGCRDVAVPRNGWGTEGAALGDDGLLEWGTLDAQWFGVAQRRRRVFALADFGDWASRRPILLEPDSLRGDSAPSREARKETAGSIGDCSKARREWPCDVSSTLDAAFATKLGLEDQHVNAGCPKFVLGQRNGDATDLVCVHGTQDPCVQTECAHTLGRNNGQENVIVEYYPINTQIRRLTPTECERLQGFPDGYSAIPWRGKPGSECPDGPRYKALGNSMAVPVMRWIGRQIEKSVAANDNRRQSHL